MIHFPEELQQAIESFTSRTSLASLLQATQELTARYRDPTLAQQGSLVSTEAQRHAYLTARMPATFSVIAAVMQELLLRAPGMPLHSLLDVGAGPGTALWAVIEAFPEIKKALLIEQNLPFIEVGRVLSQASSHQAVRQASWSREDMTKVGDWPECDLVVLSYSIGEIAEEAMTMVIRKCWKATQKILVVVEPGTPKGFQTILLVRNQLLQMGGYLIAPCPHSNECPKRTTSDWCHFSCRLNRTGNHRKAKGAQLGWEDEKYCYLIFAKEKIAPVKERILHDPLKRSGHIHLELCTSEGIEKRIVSKRDGETYQCAKKACWGEGWKF